MGDHEGKEERGRRVWLIRAGRDGTYEKLAISRNVALIGWSELGDIGAVTRDQIKERIREVSGEKRPASLASQAGQIFRFVHEVCSNDIVVLPLLSDPAHVAIGRIVGNYQYREGDEWGPDAHNTREVEWLASRVSYERFDPDLQDAFGQQGTVSEITKANALERLLAGIEDSNTPAIHLILKWSPDQGVNTIEDHRVVAEGDHGAVWWGRVNKNPEATGLAANWLAMFKEQIARGSETFVFLHGGPSTWQTRLLDITLEKGDVDSKLIPDYYDPNVSHNLWVKLTDFKHINPGEITSDYVLARSGRPVTEGSLSNQGPLIVRRQNSSTPSQYFILNQRSHSNVYNDHEGLRYEWTKRSSGAWKQLANSSGARFIYYRPGTSSDGSSRSYFGAGVVGDISKSLNEDGTPIYKASVTDFRKFDTPVPFANGPSRNARTSIQPITRFQYEKLLSQGFSENNKSGVFDVDSVRQYSASQGLRLDDTLYRQIVAALESGKHIILTGPPGTAKTSLAQAVAEVASAAGRCSHYLLTTATADWTTFETIGGLKPTKDSTLVFQPGHFLQAIENNEWLLIDELNRSNFDRAFGQLFTVLSGQPVVLPYARGDGANGPLALVPEGLKSPVETADALEIPRSWRIVATMNVFDKTLLFEMSYALMRRFAFIEVPSPAEDVFMALIEREADGSGRAAGLTKQLLILRELKDLGPAVYMDIVRYLSARESLGGDEGDGELLFDAFYSYLLPQFEGVDAHQGEVLFKYVGTLLGELGLRRRLRVTLNAVLGLELSSGGEQDEFEDVGGNPE